MKSFLSKVADYLVERHPSDLDAITVLVPTRRAAFFLKREIGTVVNKPTISPNILPIDDYISKASGLHTLQPVELLFELYKAFQTVDSQVDFDRFMGWGTVLLNDFNRIDMAMIEPKYLFDYMSEAKALERWNLDGEEPPKGSKQYFRLFDQIRQVYTLFKEKLFAESRAYPGMAYRHLAENVASLDETQSPFYFVGFNSFTASEKKIVSHFTKSKRGEALWDSDSYYMVDNRLLESGKYMREYKSKGLFGAGWKWMESDLAEKEYKINVYGVPSATLQAKVAGDLYQQLSEAQKLGEQTAIVLADEDLLLPMMNALDETIKDFNITMGLPLRNSLLFTLVESTFDLHQNIYQEDAGSEVRYSHRYIEKLFNHPFLRQYDRSEEVKGTLKKVVGVLETENKVYLTREELLFIAGPDPLIDVLFEAWDLTNARSVFISFYKIVDVLRQVYRDARNAIETEYLYLFYTLLQQLEFTISQYSEVVNLTTVKQLLFEIIKQTKVPFSGEPVSNLQIIGILETRALDFDRIILLSLNEGIFPKKKVQNSLIPYDIALEVGLPTYEHQESLAAYYFYSLIQRASDIHLMYVNTQDGMTGGERSRFIQQLEFEWPLFNKNVSIINHEVVLDSALSEKKQLILEKDDEVMEKLIHYLTNKGIYPTHIQTLLESSLKFYLKHVLGIEEEKETDETLGLDKIGTWIHNSFEELDKTYFLQKVEPTLAQIDEVLSRLFAEEFSGFVTNTGINKVYFEIAKQQFVTFMKAQHLNEGHRWPVATEQSLRAIIPYEYNGKTLLVKLGGKIDRVELADDHTLWVMDYKTGSVTLKREKTINDDIEKRDEILLSDSDYKVSYIRQLWFYQYLVYRKLLEPEGWQLNDKVFKASDVAVQSGFYSLRSPDKIIANPLKFVESGDCREYVIETERLVQKLIDSLLDRTIPLS